MGEGLEPQTDLRPDASHPKDPCSWQWGWDGLGKGTGLVPAGSLAPKIFNAGASPELISVLNSPDWHRAVRGRTAGCKACTSEVNPSALAALVPTE